MFANMHNKFYLAFVMSENTFSSLDSLLSGKAKETAVWFTIPMLTPNEAHSILKLLNIKSFMKTLYFSMCFLEKLKDKNRVTVVFLAKGCLPFP
jgi:hypothetical protein